MILGGVFGLVGGGVHQRQIHLQRGIAKESAQLRFRDDFCGHQIQKNNFQGPNMLGSGPILIHNENIFLLQYIGCGQVIGYPNRHK